MILMQFVNFKIDSCCRHIRRSRVFTVLNNSSNISRSLRRLIRQKTHKREIRLYILAIAAGIVRFRFKQRVELCVNVGRNRRGRRVGYGQSIQRFTILNAHFSLCYLYSLTTSLLINVLTTFHCITTLLNNQIMLLIK